MSFFQTKLRPEDFIVTEILDQEPSGQGDYHYILLEKKGLTTFLLLDLMIKDLGFNRNMIGIAGLKDKNAITRQWISISKRDVAKYVGGVNDLLGWMRHKGKVIKATYSENMLKLGNNAGNHFDIVLVGDKVLSPEQKQSIEAFLKGIEKNGIPNFFGDQRFGYGGSNWKIGQELLAGTLRNIKGDKNTLAEKRFKVQAFASYVFNQYVIERDKKGLLYKHIPGDVVGKDKTSITGPVPGDDLALAGQDAAKLEKEVFAKVGLSQQLFDRFKIFGLFGIRRPLLLFPKKVRFNRRDKDLLLSFDLPSGAYATVVVDELEKVLRGGKGEKSEKGEKRTEFKAGFKKPTSQPRVVANKPAKDPTINPYTGQKINQDKKQIKQVRAERKKREFAKKR